MLYLLACATPSEAPVATVPDLPVSTCGDPYAWLPLERMGQVLDWEAVDEWSLDAGSIAGIAGLAGLSDTSSIVYGARVYRVRYRTQGRGEELEATGLIAVPDATDIDPVSVLYLHPTTGFEDFCAPSGRDITWAGVPMVFAGMGYAVAAPDYLGQNGFGEEASFRHPFLAAEPTAVASLDMLRALWGFDRLGMTPSRRTILVGASQGGAAALWSERYAAKYLPEANLIGNLMSVPPLDLVGWAEHGAAELSVASTGVPFALATQADWYGLDVDLGEVVQADELARIEATMDTECPSAEVPEDITSVEQIYTDTWRAALAGGDTQAWEPWSCLLEESSVGTALMPRTADVPAFVILGGADDVVLGDVQAGAVQTLCDEGQDVVAWQCEGLGHTDTVVATLQDQADWMAARAAGEAPGEGCAGVEQRVCGE